MSNPLRLGVAGLGIVGTSLDSASSTALLGIGRAGGARLSGNRLQRAT